MKRNGLLVLCLLLAAGALFAEGQADAGSDAYPSKNLEVVISFGPGGSNDVLARIASQYAEKYLGEKIVTQNYPGGGQLLGQIEAWGRPSDGYSLLTINPGIIQNPILKDAPFTHEDWQPIVLYNLDPEVFAVRADSPYETFEDLIEASKKKKITVAVPGALTNPHVCGLYVEQQTGAQLEYVYGESGAEEVMQLLGGHVDAVINTIGAVYTAVQEGDVKLLGVMGEEITDTIREVAPDAKTFYDNGYDVGYWAWRGLAVKKDTPAEIIEILADAYAKAVQDPGLLEAFNAAGFEVVFKGGEDLDEFMDYQAEYMTALLQGMEK